MNFWTSWCVSCREMSAIYRLARRRTDGLVLEVAVADNEAASRRFAEEIDVSYPLETDSDGAIATAHPTIGLHATWYSTSDGVIAAMVVGQLDQRRLEDLIDRYLTAPAG